MTARFALNKIMKQMKSVLGSHPSVPSLPFHRLKLKEFLQGRALKCSSSNDACKILASDLGRPVSIALSKACPGPGHNPEGTDTLTLVLDQGSQTVLSISLLVLAKKDLEMPSAPHPGYFSVFHVLTLPFHRVVSVFLAMSMGLCSLGLFQRNSTKP